MHLTNLQRLGYQSMLALDTSIPISPSSMHQEYKRLSLSTLNAIPSHIKINGIDHIR
jgi:hypothetical protein